MTEQRNSSDIRTFTCTTTTGIELPGSGRRRKSLPVYKTKFVVNKTKQTSLTLVRQTESQLQCPENDTIGLNTTSKLQKVARMIFLYNNDYNNFALFSTVLDLSKNIFSLVD